MKVVFLSAHKPICKKYTLNDNSEIISEPYPFVYEVTSDIVDVPNLATLASEMQTRAALGETMLKGMISRPLIKESRAGATNPEEKTDWVCLDLDGVENYQSVDLFLQDVGCAETDYIIQWSSSMGIENKTGFRCHIIMRLQKPQHPQLLKYWLMNLNLQVHNLNSQLRLTKTANSISFPLDITTCQNDKLIYISPPILGEGIPDPFPNQERIKFVQKTKRELALPYPIPTRDALRQQIDNKVNDLRQANHLPPRKTTKYKFAGSTEYMANPDAATITDIKNERGFVYFNLNGGDSWAYFHPEDNPIFIHNFKGEPVYRTEDLLPEYWAEVKKKAQSYQPSAQGLIYLAFRDFRSSNYYNGIFDVGTNQLNLSMAKNETQLKHFLRQHGQPPIDYVPDWDLIWDPHSDSIVDPVNKTVNMYEPSDFYRNGDLSDIYPTPGLPSTISKVIYHVLGYDVATIHHFINWLAVVVQSRTNTGTAWVWQGTQGTGKGVLFHHIITPILGSPNVVSKRMEELESEFTGFMENKFMVFIDEIEVGRGLYHSKITAKLKNLIVEPTISIRKMYHPPYMAKNYSNLIFASNKLDSVEVFPDDRRFNVGPYQTKPITLTSDEINDKIPKELPEFFQYLNTFPADPHKARTPIKNNARESLMNISRSALDSVIDALLEGNLEFFWDHLLTNQEVPPLIMHKYSGFRNMIIDIIKNGTTVLTRDDLQIILEWCVGNMPSSPHKFTALIKHHRLQLTQVWKYNRNVRGITVNWKFDPAWHQQALKEINSGAV